MYEALGRLLKGTVVLVLPPIVLPSLSALFASGPPAVFNPTVFLKSFLVVTTIDFKSSLSFFGSSFYSFVAIVAVVIGLLLSFFSPVHILDPKRKERYELHLQVELLRTFHSALYVTKSFENANLGLILRT